MIRYVPWRKAVPLIFAWFVFVPGSQAQMAVSGPSAPLVHVPSGALVLHDGWRIESSRVVPRPDREITAVGFDDSSWHPATVPTTLMHALVKEGVYPDPKIGTNPLRIPDINDGFNAQFDLEHISPLPNTAYYPMNPWDKPWWFRKEFDAPADYQGKTVWLNFGGINYRADVWLNGQRIADARTMAAMFQRFRFDVTKAIRPGQRNCLAVLVHPWDVEARGQEPPELFNGTGRTDREAFRNVSAQSLGGWDYVNDAADRGTGIWQDVFLETSGPVLLEHPDVMTALDLPANDQAKLTVRVFARNTAAEKKPVTLRVKITPKTFTGAPLEFVSTFTLEGNETREIFLKPQDHPELVIDHPRLWWPAAYGHPDLYHAQIDAEADGASSYLAETDFGIRTVDTRILPTGGREFFVNGRKIRISGGAWVMDPLLEKDARRYEEEVQLCVEGNHTLLRMHGASVVPPDALVDACDRQGLLLWTEFFSHGAPRHVAQTDHSKYDWSADTGLYLDCARDNILRLRSHPCLLVWVGVNEDWLPRELYDPIYNMIAALDGTHHFLPGSHQHGDEPDWVHEHSESYSGGPWIYRSPLQSFQGAADLKSKTWGFRSEVGFPTPPSINSVVKFIPDWDQPDPAGFPLNADMGFHQAHMQFTNGHIAELQKFGAPADLADYLMGWDFLNEETHRGYYEALDKNIARTGGGLLWKAIPSSPCFLWSVFDWYLRPHAGYYAMKRANRPLHVQYNMDDNSISVCNVRSQPAENLRVAVELRDPDWRIERTEEHPVSVPTDHSQEATRLVFNEAEKTAKMHYLTLRLRDADGHELDRNFYVLPGTRALEPLRQIAPVDLEATTDPLRQENGETVAVIHLHNPGAQPALMTEPSILNGAEGDEILPTFWDDRCVEVAPGETRQFTARWANDRQGAADPHLIVEGWNVRPVEIDLRDGKPVDLQLQLRRAGKADDLKAGQVERIPVTVAETAPAGSGSRVTTWPVRVQTGDGPARTIRVGAQNGRTRQVGVPVVFAQAGTAQVTVGDQPPFELAVGEAAPARSNGAVAYVDGGGAGIDSLGYKLTDGNPDTVWSAATPKKWVFLDLGTEKSVREVTLDWGKRFASSYEIQLSNDALAWRTVHAKTDGKGGLDTTDFPPDTARYVRFNGLDGPDAKGIDLREMTVR